MTQYVVEIELFNMCPIRADIGVAAPQERAEANTEYSFFASEKEASEYYLAEIQANPGMRFVKQDYQRALRITSS